MTEEEAHPDVVDVPIEGPTETSETNVKPLVEKIPIEQTPHSPDQDIADEKPLQTTPSQEASIDENKEQTEDPPPAAPAQPDNAAPQDEDEELSDAEQNAHKEMILQQQTRLVGQLGDLQTSVTELTKELEATEQRALKAEREAKLRLKTIDGLKRLYDQAVQDLQSSDHSTTIRNQQISSLKQTIRELQSALAKEKQHITEQERKIERYEIKIKKHTDDIAALQAKIKEVEASLENHPRFSELMEANARLEKHVDAEKEGRMAALAAWQKANGALKEVEQRGAQMESGLLQDIKTLRERNASLAQKLEWEKGQSQQSKQKLNVLEEELQTIQTESVQLKIKLGTLETELKSQTELERMKAQSVIESAMTEMKWKEHVMFTQLEECRRKFEVEHMEKLKAQKAMKNMETQLYEDRLMNTGNLHQKAIMPPNFQSSTPVQKNAIRKAVTKQRYRELDDLDAEINQLKHELAGRNQQKQHVFPPSSFYQPQESRPPPQFPQQQNFRSQFNPQVHPMSTPQHQIQQMQRVPQLPQQAFVQQDRLPLPAERMGPSSVQMNAHSRIEDQFWSDLDQRSSGDRDSYSNHGVTVPTSARHSREADVKRRSVPPPHATQRNLKAGKTHQKDAPKRTPVKRVTRMDRLAKPKKRPKPDEKRWR